MPTFNIVQVAEPGSPALLRRDGLPYLYDDGETAAREAKRLAKEMGIKLAAKVIIDRRWRDRELARFGSGEYLQLPWAHMDWWCEARAINRDIERIHYAHVSQKKTAMIAYTANEEDGSKDKQTVIKPSKYLERFCLKALNYYRLDVRKVAAQFAAKFAPAELKFASEAEDIQYVYEMGPASCMSGPMENYLSARLDIHPVSTYAAGDLQVAYLKAVPEKDEDGDEFTDEECSIIARALVWPEKKTHSRIYGDVHRMQAALQRAGYVFGPPLGAKIRRIKYDSQRFVAPYIDAGSSTGGGSLALYDKGSHLVIGRKDIKKEYYPCSMTEGVTGRAIRGVQCSECDEYVEQGNHVDVRISCDVGDTRVVCGACLPRGFWRNGLDSHFYDQETCPPVHMDTGLLWNTQQFAEHGAVCALSKLNCDKSNMVRMHNGVMWSYESYKRHGFHCSGTGKYYPRTERVVTYRGNYISREFAHMGWFKCEQCQAWAENSVRIEKENHCLCPNCEERNKLMRKAADQATSPKRTKAGISTTSTTSTTSNTSATFRWTEVSDYSTGRTR